MRESYDVRERPLRHAVVVLQLDGIGAEAQRTETVMINLAGIDERLQDHETRVARINRDAWMRDATNSAPDDRAHGASNLAHRMRRTIGQAVVDCGEWLQGSPDAESISPAPNNGLTSAGR